MTNDKLLERIEILYQDENILAVNKPAGLVVHSDGRTEEKTLVDWILENYPEIENVGEPLELQTPVVVPLRRGTTGQAKDYGLKTIPRPGIVHRLDRETSGVILIAKNQDSFLHLKDQFQKRKTEKTYQAFVYGEMKEGEGEIDRAIGRSAKDFRLWSAQRGARGKMREAKTLYKVLAKKDNFSLVEVYPLTGRTHQIRVHFKAINHPIICDKLYAPKRECALGFNRLALHAQKIKFQNLDNQKFEIEAPYPEDFKLAIKESGLSLEEVGS